MGGGCRRQRRPTDAARASPQNMKLLGVMECFWNVVAARARRRIDLWVT
jgi:hypothetical protein